jgi:hypothetical protein
VSAALTGLSASTGYHYRLVVATAAGPLAGGDRSFTTAAAPSGGTPDAPSGGTPDGPSGGTPDGPGDPNTPGGDTGGGGALTSSILAAEAKLKGTKTAGSDGTVTLGDLTCPLACGKVEIVATMTSPGAASAKRHRTVVGRGTGTVKAGKRLKLKFRLTKAGRKALKKAGKLKLAVTVTVTGAGGKPVSTSRSIVVKAKKSKH